ncbi:serine protease easter isoform X1 [Dendroctonus ponderosae]|nr:serine protease easter isoform X1 [Dendroctonus ponderosae]ERL85365.1 hypothetical protein D910_02785 [Dendroctonus ponderosae]
MKSICFIVVLLIGMHISYGQLANICRTPNELNGECISLMQCDPLFSLLKKRPISSATADLLRRSQCGFFGSIPKVCCPVEEPTLTTSTTPASNFNVLSGEAIVSNLLPDTDICGTGAQNRIYGGEKADLDEFPWMVLVEYERPNGQIETYCGGVLINSRYILTAAHCLKGKDLPKSWKMVSVRLGEYNTDTKEDCIEAVGARRQCAPPAVYVAVEETIAHENYDPYHINQYNDIALLRLIRNVHYSDYVRPICLPKTSTLLSKSYVNKNLVVAGWGRTENSSASNIKLKLEVPVENEEKCFQTYRKAHIRLGASQLCAGGKKGRDSCTGDSGGPLMGVEATAEGNVNWYSVGVVSFGRSPCGLKNWPGVYTKVANYVPWIVSNLRP